ncbi:MAG: RES family NAD+ phosphorylase [Verrucomicrobiales bacterium]|nr:RES family NAD+ phosphorylase [Verrucomicrobiales bacterium]
MRGFRIALESHGRTAREILSGWSGFTVDGRWHSSGRRLDYAAESLSLAVLERLVHYKRFNDLQAHVVCSIDLPGTAVRSLGEVPAGWDGTDLLPAAQALGNAWCDRQDSPALRVPSAVTRGEFNLLLNTHHPDWDWSWVNTPQPFRFDNRLQTLLAQARSRRQQ